jgi:hypothetical protein
MLASAGGDLTPRLEDWRSLDGRDFGQHDGDGSATFDEGIAACRADVLHPLRIVSEHRDEVAVALVICGDKDS